MKKVDWVGSIVIAATALWMLAPILVLLAIYIGSGWAR